MSKIFVKDFINFSQTVPQILKEAGLAEKINTFDKLSVDAEQSRSIKKQNKILLKPNLTAIRPPPCTTPVELVEEVVRFCRANSKTEIIIAEGSGGCDTEKAFVELGYKDLSQKYDIKLIDLNQEERIFLKNEKALVLKKVKLPKIIFDSFFINLPVLKEHNEAIVTCAAKNLFGLYLNQKIIPSITGWWNKSELHLFGVHKAIIDLNNYVKSDFVLVDASIGQRGNEINGFACQPAIKKLIAGFDAMEIDRFCAPLLGHEPDEIPYLNF
jgi:uncharacterized protein (DUF362 family)